jgi:NADH-quinone oxidoreductase subunit L
MDHAAIVSVLLASPLVGFLVNGIRRNHHSANVAGAISSLAVFISFVCAVVLWVDLQGLLPEERHIHVIYGSWMAVESLKINFGFWIDQLSSLMILIITGVGFLIHLFSIGYMSHDKGVAKYFSYLNFFIFNMLVLVLGDSLVTLFVGWEGVGLASYLLIGFWFTDAEKAAAGMKAFIVNRIGDAAFLIGMFIFFTTFGTLNIHDLNGMAPTITESAWLMAATLGTLFLFIGATGKSAQIPLYVWLPDAMAGPTPVSALIHAATMVTAGVYMIVRLNPIFMATPITMMVIAIIGALTIVMAASIGIVQNDIKKILAYSTVSQLGYMFLACGVGAFTTAFFHLMTHAFFKALMFLGSGSVIHAMDGEQDIRKMGGLKKYLPWTHLTFMMGWLAIIGAPGFAGFFSKDEILWMSYHSPRGHWSLWALGVLGAVMTAFYMTRLMCLTFWGRSRVDKKVHPHESPATMLIPLFVLAILSVVGGYVGIPHVIAEILPGHPLNILENWFEPIIKTIPGLSEAEPALEWGLMGTSVGLALISTLSAYQLYIKNPEAVERLTKKISGLHQLVYKKYFVDEFYFGFIVNPLIKLSENLWAYIDVRFIDKCTYWAGDLIKGSGSLVRSLQNGNLQSYAMYIGIGLVVALSLVMMR